MHPQNNERSGADKAALKTEHSEPSANQRSIAPLRESSSHLSPMTVTSPKLGWRTAILIAVTFLLLLGAIYAIHLELERISVQSIFDEIRGFSAGQLGLALLGTLIGYLALAGYDRLALVYLGEKLSYGRTILASFSAYAISNSLGIPILTGGAVRYRLYSSWGLSASDIAVISLLTGITLYLGAISVTGVGLIFEANLFEELFHLPEAGAYALAVLCLGVTLAVLALSIIGPQSWTIRSLTFPRPSLAFSISQIFVGIADWSASAFVLYVLLPTDSSFSFLAFVPLFTAAAVAGSLSGLPGGIGVFEAVILLLFPNGNEASIAAALVVYRAIYYLMPLMIAALLFGGHQLISARKHFSMATRFAESFASAVAPTLFSLLLFITGLIMLASAVTPSTTDTLHAIAKLIPLGLIELSHFAASLVGFCLLIIAMGLRRRLNGAWLASVILLSIGTLFTVLKGGGVSETAFLFIMVLILSASRSGFYRKASLMSVELTWPWGLALFGGVAATLWLGLLSYRHVEYANELWWQFSLHGDAARYLRSGASIAALLIIFFTFKLATPHSRGRLVKSSQEDLTRAASILENFETGHADAYLALLGDKQFLFSKSGKSFLMYGVHGKSWIALSGPVGIASEQLELMWKFRELADIYDAWPIFYSFREDILPEIAEIGLAVQKVGETALVDLTSFTLEGSSRAKLRQAQRRITKEGWHFEVAEQDRVESILPQLKQVSDEWLTSHQGTEKGFTLGAFDPDYIKKCSVAIVRKEDQISAFANLWMTPNNEELSIDLMRYSKEAPKGVMDSLFTELILWGKQNGYQEFELGMAPLSGLDSRRTASLMTNIGAFVFEHGEALYGFEGLREYKDKFDPHWEPLYLAAPGQLVVPVALGDVALLTSGGFLGMLRRG